VWDLGSNPADLLPLRQRIRAGEVPGPNIFFAGSIFPKDGHPSYLPPEMQLPEAATPERAAQLARTYMQMGLDGVKLFTGSYKGEDKPVVNMDADIAKAAVDVAHAAGKPVFAHPQNTAGIDAVIAAGVDVMAHAVTRQTGYTAEQLAHFKRQNIALIPTFSVFAKLPVPAAIGARIIDNVVAELKGFADNGGSVLFGTDVGFIQLYDTTLEYELMHRALTERQVLASLTTNPAAYFKVARKGKVEQGFDADLVILDGDPIADVRNLAKVVTTIRAGQVIYQKP
jgi:imidazolonepropionase-like amidohydrolase